MIEIITLGDFDIIKDDQSIFETMTSELVLQKGVGHLEGTSLPYGGGRNTYSANSP